MLIKNPPKTLDEIVLLDQTNESINFIFHSLYLNLKILRLFVHQKTNMDVDHIVLSKLIESKQSLVEFTINWNYKICNNVIKALPQNTIKVLGLRGKK